MRSKSVARQIIIGFAFLLLLLPFQNCSPRNTSMDSLSEAQTSLQSDHLRVAFGIAPVSRTAEENIYQKGGPTLKSLLEWLNTTREGTGLPEDSLQYQDPRGVTKTFHVTNGSRRKLTKVVEHFQGVRTAYYRTEPLSLKICQTGLLLADVAESSSPLVQTVQSQLNFRTKEVLKIYADVLIDQFQFKNAAQRRNGGFKVSTKELAATTFGSAMCGRMLIRAAKITNDDLRSGQSTEPALDLARQTRYAASLVSLNSFLQKMKRPKLFAGLSSFRFLNNVDATSESIGYFMDEIDTGDRLLPVASMWTAIALAFQYEYAVFNGESVVVTTYRDQLVKFIIGAKQFAEYFMPKYSVGLTESSQIAPNGYLVSCSKKNNLWNRRTDLPGVTPSDPMNSALCVGDPNLTSSIGSDMPEYLIVTLEVIWPEKAKDIFDIYHNATSLKARTGGGWESWGTINPLPKPFIGWGFEIAIGQIVNSVFTNVLSVNGIHNYANENLYHKHSGYDFDPITEKTKARNYPAQVADAVSELLDSEVIDAQFQDPVLLGKSHWVYAMLDINLQPKRSSPTKLSEQTKILEFISKQDPTWTANDSVRLYSMGASTTAHNAALILRAIENLR